jgi:DNA-binding transcriptional LysR family regulator
MRLLGSQLTLHKLEVFCTVVELQSISRAAHRIGIAQPVVTAHIRALQDKLGVRLTIRRGRNIALTEEGKRAYRWAKDVVVRTRELEREFFGAPQTVHGAIAIAASLTVGSYVLPGPLAEFRRLNPHAEISISVTTPRECVEAVRDGECDFGVTILDSRQNADGLEISRLWEERMVLVAAPHSTHVGAVVATSDIAALPFVAAQRGSPRRDIEDNALRLHGIVRHRIELEIGHAEGMKEAVFGDAGVAFLFESSVRRDVQHDALRLVATPDLEITAPVYLIARRGKSLSAAQQKMFDFVNGALRQAPPPAADRSDAGPELRPV